MPQETHQDPRKIHVALAAERAAFMREYLEYGFALRDAVVGDDKELRRSVDAPTISWIAAAVALGHAEGRPMNASKIADFLDLDRNTVRRKLEIMIALHAITRDGDDFFIEPTRAANVPPERRRRYARIFHDASRSLWGFVKRMLGAQIEQ